MTDLTWRPAMPLGPRSPNGNHESHRWWGHPAAALGPQTVQRARSLAAATHMAVAQRATGQASQPLQIPAAPRAGPARTVPSQSHGSRRRCQPPCIDAAPLPHPSIHPLPPPHLPGQPAARCTLLFTFFCAPALQVRAGSRPQDCGEQSGLPSGSPALSPLLRASLAMLPATVRHHHAAG